MPARHRIAVLGAAGGLTIASVAIAQETTTYSYDALGRLTGSSISGGPNDNRTTATCFDAAGNRTRYDMATSAPAVCPTPTPTPTPT
jgi:YD repeat-containing protein